MSKRGFDEELLLPVAADWGQSASPTPPSPIASPIRVPGAWRDEPNASDTRTPSSSFFETLSDLCATVTLGNLIRLPFHLARRYFRRQRILAVPIVRDDGARKKRLVDLGPADRPQTKPPATKSLPQPKPRPTFTRRVLLSSELQSKRAAAAHTLPGQWPEDQAAQQAIPDNVWMSIANGSPAPAPTPAPSDNIWMCDAAAGSVTTLSDLGSPQCASTPYRDYEVHVSNANTPTKASSRHIISPVSRKVSFAPVVNKALQLKTSPDDGKHTKLDRTPKPKTVSPTSNACTPLQESLKKTAAFKLAIAKVAEDARKANTQYLAAHKARANNDAKLRPNEDADGADQPDDSFVYQNDQSFLSDAPSLPQKKSVSFPATVRAKPFYRDSRVDQMLDSIIEEIKTCEDPARAIDELKKRDLSWKQGSSLNQASSQSQSSSEDDGDSEFLPQGSPQPTNHSEKDAHRGVPPQTFYDDDLDESLMSNELLTELLDDVAKKLLISPPQPPLPAVPTKPLIATLTTSELDTLEAAAQKSDYGMKPDFKLVKHLTAHDFGTLVPNMFKGDKKAWLNDEIINEYLTILVDHGKNAEGWVKKPTGPAPPCHTFASQWYQNVKKDISKVKNWAGRQRLGGKNFLDAKVLLYPICEDSHWRLLAIKPKDRTILYLDSLGGSGAQYVEAAHKYLKMELGALYDASEWQLSTAASMLQENARDCGVFTLLNALVVLRGEEHDRVAVNDGMNTARRRIAVTLLAGKATTEMD